MSALLPPPRPTGVFLMMLLVADQLSAVQLSDVAWASSNGAEPSAL
jgi:hypothetical protein